LQKNTIIVDENPRPAQKLLHHKPICVIFSESFSVQRTFHFLKGKLRSTVAISSYALHENALVLAQHTTWIESKARLG